MEQPNNMPANSFSQILTTWGLWAVLIGAFALILVFVQIVGPMMTPKPPVGSQVGEIAGEITRSAWRSLLGLPKPEPEVVPVPIWTSFGIVAPALGVIAIVLSVISGVSRENWRYSVYGTGLGVAAVVFNYFWWVALLIVGAALLIAIIENIGSIFSFDFFGS